ncbi:MAG: phage tail tape measure protein, partial [Dehalococcoidales bacterium]|nr:phage tail tape measure protein [Dehalococcoidales bacterium]
MAILAADFKLAEGALANLDNFAKGIAKTGTASEKSQSQLKSATTGIKEFVAQVKALQTPFQQMIALSEKGGKEWVKYKAALKEASVGAKQLQADYVHLISAGGSWKATLDGIYSSQARSIINSKAEVVAAQNLEATFNKQIATRAQIIGLKNGSTQASLRALAVDEAELAITKAKYAADVNSAKQLAVNTILASNETLEIKRQALALAGIPPIKMAVVKATEVLTVAETGYTAAAVKSAAQATKQGMALELLSAQSKKRSALLSQLNALENGYAASLAKSLAPLQARVALSQAKNAADINLAKQIVLNTILASNETLEIKRQALALAGIPPIKMAVVKATQAMAVSSAESAVATNAASTAAQRGTGAFTTYGSAVRGAAGALGMLWFAYGQLLPLMAAFAVVRTGQAAVKMGMEFEYSAHMIQTLAKDVENATISVEEINQELLGMEGLRHGPLELAKGMKEFAKAGVAPKDALRDMATMSKFATIAEMDLGEAIKKVIGLTLAFKPTMEAATGELFTFADAANMTAAAAMLTITDVDEMANAFAYAAELGVVSGMKFQEVAAALGIMANAGIRGTKGATSLRMGMIKLQTPTDKALQKIKALNKEFTAFHEDGSAKNIVEVFRDLNKVLEGLPDKERVAIFAELFTARSLRAGAVISQQVKELDSFIKKLEEAAEGIGFIEEKYQDLGTTARAELEFLKVEFEKILLGMTDAGGIAEVLSDMTAALKEMGPGIILVGKAIGAVFHDIINFSLLIRKTVGENISFVIGVFTGENSISDAVDFVKARLKSFTDYIESWNIRQYFKENFEAFDRYTITFASQFEKSAILIEKYWKNLNLYMKIIWGETINWIIDKLFLIPDNLLKIVNGLSELTKGVPGLNAYSKGMGAIGEGLEKLISGVKGFYKIDLSKERSELEAINAEYDTRIKKSEEVYQQLRDEHDALWNTKEVVDNLGESFGVLRAQMAGEAAAPTGTPWGYFFGAGGIGEF